jgi:glycosyltransferase involved in cell wall biosynthesis
MKILHVLYSGLGGHGNVFFSMVEANENHEYNFEALFNGIEQVREEYIKRCSGKTISWHYIKKNPGLDIRYYINLYKAIKKSEPEIIFLHGSAAALPAKLAKLTTGCIQKIIVRETQANHLKTKTDWLYLATAMATADKMVYLSDDYKEQVKLKMGWLFKDKNSAVIPNGIDLETFKKGALTENGPRLLLGMQSRLNGIKDHHTLLDALALLLKQKLPAEPHLMIAGDGEYMDTLIKYTASLGMSSNVTFTGMLEEKELVPFIQKLDIYIHASLGETMSTAIMQAMACGKPVIASDVPGINNMIINNQTGLLVPAKNAGSLCNAVQQLASNRPLGRLLAENAFTFATENYSSRKMLQRYNEIFID